MPKTYKRIGYVSPEQFERFIKGHEVTEWCGGTTDKTYRRIEWSVPALEAAGYLKELVESLRKIKDEHNSDDVRLVFGFDS